MPEHEQAESQALRRRLQAADPARAVNPDPDLATDLVRRTRERAMQQSQPTADDPATDVRRRRWVPLAAAAAVLAVGGTAYVATLGDSSPPTGAPSAGSASVTELALPGGQLTGRCMQVTPQTVANAETALAGTVTSVEEGSVALDVERWYAGGDADEVRLAVATPEEAPLLLAGQPEFRAGQRWLVTATDGRVNSCGFTAPWSTELAQVFDAAFPAG